MGGEVEAYPRRVAKGRASGAKKTAGPCFRDGGQALFPSSGKNFWCFPRGLRDSPPLRGPPGTPGRERLHLQKGGLMPLERGGLSRGSESLGIYAKEPPKGWSLYNPFGVLVRLIFLRLAPKMGGSGQIPLGPTGE